MLICDVCKVKQAVAVKLVFGGDAGSVDYEGKKDLCPDCQDKAKKAVRKAWLEAIGEGEEK